MTDTELSDDEIIVLDVVNSTDPTEPNEAVTNSTVLEPPEIFEAEPPDAKTAGKQISDLIRQAADRGARYGNGHDGGRARSCVDPK